MMENMPPEAMGGMDAPMMANMPLPVMDAIAPEQMVNMSPDVAGMMPDDGGMGALGGALDPAPADNVAPMDPAGDALSGAMDQVADQGAGGGAPDMGVPADAGDAAPMDDPNAPDPNAPPDEVDPIV